MLGTNLFVPKTEKNTDRTETKLDSAALVIPVLFNWLVAICIRFWLRNYRRYFITFNNSSIS
jgi:hypothetical protein